MRMTQLTPNDDISKLVYIAQKQAYIIVTLIMENSSITGGR